VVTGHKLQMTVSISARDNGELKMWK